MERCGTPDASDNVIDVHINHLRRKIDERSGIKLVHTVRRLGLRPARGSPVVFGGVRLASARSLPIRTRLTIWYVLVLGAALLVFAGATSAVLYWQLSRQLTRFAIQDVETIEGLLFFDRHGTLQLNEDYHNHTESRKVLERLLEVLSPDGKLLYRNWRLGSDSLGAAPFPGEGVGGYSPRTIRTKEGSLVLVVSRRHVMGGRPLVIRVGYRKDTVSAQIWQFLSASFTAMPLALLLVAIFGFQLARRSLAPMVDMARLAEQITAENLRAAPARESA